MTSKSRIVVRERADGTWDIGRESDEDGFDLMVSGYRSKEAAEQSISSLFREEDPELEQVKRMIDELSPDQRAALIRWLQQLP